MNVERAARQIIAACKRGEAEVVLSIQGKRATKFHALFPELTTDLLGLINRLLPEPGSIGSERAKGVESTSAFSPSFLAILDDQAAERNNEMARPMAS